MQPSQTLPSATSVVLADEQPLVRYAVKSILEKTQRYTIVGEASNADEALKLIASLKPDIAVIDLGLPGKSGMQVIYEIKERLLASKVIILSSHIEETKVEQAVLAGAAGYILKTCTPSELLIAVDRGLKGDVILPERFLHLRESVGSQRRLANGANPGPHRADPLDKLSKREREVFFLLAEGLPNRIIAKRLFISPRTVETHRARVIKKLGFGSTADLVRYAIRNNLLTL